MDDEEEGLGAVVGQSAQSSARAHRELASARAESLGTVPVCLLLGAAGAVCRAWGVASGSDEDEDEDEGEDGEDGEGAGAGPGPGEALVAVARAVATGAPGPVGRAGSLLRTALRLTERAGAAMPRGVTSAAAGEVRGLLLRPADAAAKLAAGLLRGGDWGAGGRGSAFSGAPPSPGGGGAVPPSPAQLRGCCEAVQGLLRLAGEGKGPLLRGAVDCAGLMGDRGRGAPGAWRLGAGRALLSLLKKGGPDDPVAHRLLAAAGSALAGCDECAKEGEVLMEAGRAGAACLGAAKDLAILPATASAGVTSGPTGSAAVGAAWARGARLAAAAVDFACEVFAEDGGGVTSAFGASGLGPALEDALSVTSALVRGAPVEGTSAEEAAEAACPGVMGEWGAAAANGPALVSFRKEQAGR